MSKETVKLRLIHVAPTPFGSAGVFGGGERYPLELARALAAEVDCELLTFGRHDWQGREPSGLRLRTLRSVALLGGHPAHPIAPGLVRAISSANLVHTHHMRAAPSRIAAIAARARGHPAVVTDHGLQGDSWGGLLQRLFDRFLVVSSYSARELGAPRGRTRVVYGGADTERFFPDRGEQRRGVLFVGRLTPHKGVDRLIRALPPGAPLLVAGSAGHDARLPEREYPSLLRRLAADRDVRFVDAIPDPELPPLYRRAAVVAVPSVARTCYGRAVRVSELLSLTTLEAMASGTPVVCSRIGGLPEVVRDGETGFLVEPGNVAELRERLATLLNDAALAGRMGERARELVMERFTWKACADRCLSAYAEVASGAGPGTARAQRPASLGPIGTRREETR